MSQFSVITQSAVTINVTSSANSFGTERNFQKDLSIAALKVVNVNNIILMTSCIKYFLLITIIKYYIEYANIEVWRTLK